MFYNKSQLAPTKIASAILASPINVPKLRISIVQYLNTAPLVWGFTHGPLRGKYDLSFTVPSLCAEALRTGAADIAIIPAIEYQRIDDLVILPGMAIASKNRVRSLLVVSKMPIERAGTIALDASSRSTQALTRILCAQKWKIDPEFFEVPPDLPAMLQTADAALLIGDPALRLSIAIEPTATRGASGEEVCAGRGAGLAATENLHIYDVVEEWRKMTNLPAVLAVWAARRDVVTPGLSADFAASLDFGLRHIPDICAKGARELQLPEKDLRLYLEENIDYSLDDKNLQGLLAFFRHAGALGLIPCLNPISVAGRAGFLATAPSVDPEIRTPSTSR
jgi:chorismate dehydratase